MVTKFKIVRHGWKYHVIGFEGIKNPKGGKAVTYREQCVSSHLTLGQANKALGKYAKAKLALSKYAKAETVLQRIGGELPIGIIVAIVMALLAEVYLPQIKAILAITKGMFT